MPGQTRIRPVRRSALEAIHARLGARWLQEDVRWPHDYGDPAKETAALEQAAGLIDWGPSEKVSVQGPEVASALRRVGLECRQGAITSGVFFGFHVDVWGLAPDEALLICSQTHEVSEFLTSKGIANVGLSSALSVLKLVGPNARTVLMELCPVDLSDSALPDGHLAHGPVANVRVAFARQSFRDVPGYTVLVPRDYATYLWRALLDNGEVHGLRPVGAGALGQD